MATTKSEDNLGKIEEEVMQKMKSRMQDLYLIWDKVGINNEKKNDRSKVAWKHLLNLLDEIIEEENGFYNSILERIDNYSKEISELSKLLSVPHIGDVEGTLLVKEETLRKELFRLTRLKQKRLKKLEELRCIENKYCMILGWPTHKLSSITGVPSEEDLVELEQYVSTLKKERDQRYQKFCATKRELTIILEKTELPPETSFEKEILTSSEENFSLTNETFIVLDQVVKKIKDKKNELENERKVMLEKLTILWDRLKVSEDERKKFLSKHADYKVSTLKSIKEEILKCEEIKRQNLKMYINNLREELVGIWNDCFLSEAEKECFKMFHSTEFTEDVLKAHEIELEKWRLLHAQTKGIREKIEERGKLWDLLIVFENKAADPNRFKNRGGNLLQEERERKKLQKDLPALENEIFLDIENYEKETGKPFSYFGQDYREVVNRQWEERNNEKENEKILRHKQRTLVTENEMTLGTPSVKRCAITPKSAPSKFFKSSVGVPLYRTPQMTNAKCSPRTVGKQSIKNKLSSTKNGLLRSTLQKSVLKEINKKRPSGSQNETTYSTFANTMNQASRSKHRSSVLCSRKVGGTRISTSNKSKRKSGSGNKSSRKSARNMTEITSKLTPARGKLGLPFLI